MLKIISKPDSGKTKELLTKVSKTGGIIVCAHPDRMLDKATNYGIDVEKVDFVRYEDYISSNKLANPIYIDDLDSFLHTFDYHIEGYNVDDK